MFSELTGFVLGAGFNLFIAVLIVRLVYYPSSPNKNFVFTFLAFNTIIYFVLGLFTSVELSVGVGFGLFAIFSVLRYRTDEMPIREMTYLFVLIALPVMNSLLLTNADYARLIAANGILLTVLTVLEREWGFHFETSKKVLYEKIDLITPENREEMLADLRGRTGLPIKRIEINRVDFLRDTAEIKIFYDEPRNYHRRDDPSLFNGEFPYEEEEILPHQSERIKK